MSRMVVAVLIGISLALSGSGAWAMGLRSFVALPIEKGGTVLRLFDEYNFNSNVNVLTTNLAYGISGRQTFFLGLPYRLSPSGGNRLKDLRVMYRHIVWQVDDDSGTSRLGLLGGVLVPTNGDRDVGVQAGAVATFVRRRHEWDVDALWVQGTGKAPNAARYDISWQYRLTPASYPKWGSVGEWHSVLELNGRWAEGQTFVHQVTAGLQRIHRRWVLEGGLVQDLNGAQDTRLVLSLRMHF